MTKDEAIDRLSVAFGECRDAIRLQAEAIGQLIHEPTMSRISVYKPISRFKRLMLRLCFGLKYEKI